MISYEELPKHYVQYDTLFTVLPYVSYTYVSRYVRYLSTVRWGRRWYMTKHPRSYVSVFSFELPLPIANQLEVPSPSRCAIMPAARDILLAGHSLKQAFMWRGAFLDR